MAMETVKARYQVKDEEGNTVMDDDGKPMWAEAEVEYDFGDDLDGAIDLCGAETVFSNYKANATVALQGLIRSKLKAGVPADQIQEIVAAWRPGMVMEKTQVDPATAIKNAFNTWSPEKKAEFLASLGVEG